MDGRRYIFMDILRRGNGKGKRRRGILKSSFNVNSPSTVLRYCQPVSFFVPLIDVVELFFPVLQKNPEMRCSFSKKLLMFYMYTNTFSVTRGYRRTLKRP